MPSKRMFILIVIAALLTALVFADDDADHQAQRSERTEADVPMQTVSGAVTTPVSPPGATVLEPGLASIESSYGLQMQALNTELSTATTDDQREAIQQRMQSLKLEWTTALANRQLEMARQKKDLKSEAEALGVISRITNPPAPAQNPVARDPNAGISVEGGAK